MSPIPILKKAQKNRYAVGQFNISTDEQIRAVVEIIRDLNSPVIIGMSESEREFIGTEQAVAYSKGLEKEIQEHPEEVKPYKILAPAVEEMKKVVEEKIKLFGSQNKL